MLCMTNTANILETEASAARIETLQIAVELGADEKTLLILRDANRVSRHTTIVLPAQNLENLSRGRGWCRSLWTRGSETIWGERDKGGYRVGPGRWSVGATDGFNRKKADEWIVKHVQVGDQTWTIAD